MALGDASCWSWEEEEEALFDEGSPIGMNEPRPPCGWFCKRKKRKREKENQRCTICACLIKLIQFKKFYVIAAVCMHTNTPR